MMADRLMLLPRHRRMMEETLQQHVPGAEVWAYGSRVNGRAHEASDLDLAVRGPALQPIGAKLARLVEAFKESDLPIIVQVCDWGRLPKSFQREIERDYVVVQPGLDERPAQETGNASANG